MNLFTNGMEVFGDFGAFLVPDFSKELSIDLSGQY